MTFLEQLQNERIKVELENDAKYEAELKERQAERTRIEQQVLARTPIFVAELKKKMIDAARQLKREIEVSYSGFSSEYDEIVRLLKLDSIENVSSRLEHYDAYYDPEDSYLNHGPGTNFYIKIKW